MNKTDLNRVLEGDYEPRVGDAYEIAPGKWGKLKPPTGALQDKVLEIAKGMENGESEKTDLDICYMILDGLPEGISYDDAVANMPGVAVTDFFILLTKTGERLGAGIRRLKDSAPQEK